MNLNQFALEGINPLRGLDLPGLIRRIEAGERGYYGMLQWTYRSFEGRDPIIRAVKRALIASLGSLKWDIKLPEGIDDDASKKQLAEKQEKDLRAAYDAITNLRAALNFLALSDLRGFSHLEKVYAGAINKKTSRPFDEEREPWDVIELRLVEQWFWAKAGFYGPWLYNRTAKETNTGESIDLANYVIHTVDDPADPIFAELGTKRRVNDADWDGFLEDYGVPPMFIVLPPNVPKEREAEYQRAAELAVSRARGSLPNGASLESPTGTGSGGAGVFAERLGYLDEQIVLAGTSGKLTVLTESGSGTLAGGAQKESFDDIAQAIADQISGVMQAQFDKPLLARLYPNEPALAYFEFAAVDKEQTAKVLGDAKTAHEAGYRMEDGEISEKAGYKLTYVGDARAGAQKNGENSQLTAAPATAGPAPAQPTPTDQATTAIADDLHLTAQFVAPAKKVIDELLAAAQSGDVTNEALLAKAEDFLKLLPEIAESADVTEVAAAMEKALTAAAEKTLAGK
jgi:hypothetical protein